MNNTATSTSRRNNISGVEIGKVDRKHLIAVMKKLKIEFNAEDDTDALTVAAYAHFDKNTPEDDQVQCDACNGISSSDLDACPYCGAENDEESSAAAESDHNDAPAPKAEAPKESQAMTTTTNETGKKKSKSNGAAAPSESKALVVDAKELDKAVSDIRDLQTEGAVNYWKIGRRVLDVFKGQLWKQRVAEEKQVFRSFDSWCKEELDMTPAHAYQVMDVAEHFTEAKVKQFGASKLMLVAQAPEKAQPKLLEAVEKGASWRDVKKEVTALKKRSGHRRPAREGAKANRSTEAASKARSEKATKAKKEVTVAKLLGRETVKLFCKPTTKKYDEKSLKAAKKIDDVPWGKLELINGVVQEFFIQRGGDGSLRLIVQTQRQGE